MANPTPTPEQLEALTLVKSAADAGVEGKLLAVETWEKAIATQEKVDEYFAGQFDFNDSDIIVKYETERRWLDGQELDTPIVEQDIIDFTNDTGRLYDSADVDAKIFTPKRISQFDGTPLLPTDDEHETFLLPEQDIITSNLITFLPQLTTFDGTAVTTSDLDGTSTTLTFTSNVAETFSIGNLLFIGNGTDAFVVQIDTIGGVCTGEDNPPQTDQVSCEADNGTWEDALGITVLIGTSGTILAGASLGQKSYTGFNNTERTNKVASDSDFQPLMDTLLADLQDKFDRRLVVLGNQKIALEANLDENLDPDALTNVDTSLSAVTGFLGLSAPSTIDISDTGLTAINNESTLRDGQVAARLSVIPTAISSGGFYDARYNEASNRGRLDNGSLRLITEYTKAKDSAASGAVSAQALSDRYGTAIG